MNPRRHATLGRVLTVSAALAILILAGSLAFAAFASIMQTARERDRELASAGRYAHLYVQSRLGHAHMLALDLSLGRDTLPAGTAGVTHVRIGPDGKLLSSSTGRTLPRLQANLPRLSEGDASGIELDDQGTLVAVGSALSPHGVVVVFMPFTTADVQAIHEATGREVSLYAGRTCVATTLRKAGGAAATGLVLSSDELAALATGALTRTTDLLLDGSRYRQTLQPLLGLDGGVVGAVGVAERPPDVADLLPHLWPSLLAWALGGAILALLWAAVGMRLRRPLVMLERDLGQLVSRQHANGLSGDYCLAELDTLVQHVNQLCAARAALAQSSERLNDRLVQMQALAMLGRLTSGVAHDLNNPLATIRGLADIMLTSELDAEVRSELESIRKQAEYSGHMVSTLLAYARRQRGEPEKVNLNEIISQSLELLAFQARVTNTRCEMRLDERLPLTWGDPSQLQQVVLNLVNNAMQAMASSHGGGTLRVESAWSPGEGASLGWITLRVRDDGAGIPEDVLPRLFQPYFTTRGTAGGTGLGLSISADIVRRHNGRIWAENNPRGGACFTVQLPVAAEPPSQAPPEPPPRPTPVFSEGPRRVLLADADPQRLHLLANVLRRQGYQICTVSDGEKARGRMDKERFDLVVCGLDLPLVDGRQLYTWARAKRPEMARRLVFIVSGEVSTELEAFLQVARAWVLLPPFQEDAVRAVIGQALQTALQAADVT